MKPLRRRAPARNAQILTDIREHAHVHIYMYLRLELAREEHIDHD